MNTLIHTPFGDIEGITGQSVTRFLGVPFAKKPLGAFARPSWWSRGTASCPPKGSPETQCRTA